MGRRWRTRAWTASASGMRLPAQPKTWRPASTVSARAGQRAGELEDAGPIPGSVPLTGQPISLDSQPSPSRCPRVGHRSPTAVQAGLSWRGDREQVRWGQRGERRFKGTPLPSGRFVGQVGRREESGRKRAGGAVAAATAMMATSAGWFPRTLARKLPMSCRRSPASGPVGNKVQPQTQRPRCACGSVLSNRFHSYGILPRLRGIAPSHRVAVSSEAESGAAASNSAKRLGHTLQGWYCVILKIKSYLIS